VISITTEMIIALSAADRGPSDFLKNHRAGGPWNVRLNDEDLKSPWQSSTRDPNNAKEPPVGRSVKEARNRVVG